MYEYVDEKIEVRRMDHNMVFFNKGKLYTEPIYNFAVKHGVPHSAFKEQSVAASKVSIAKEEPKVEVKKPKVFKEKE